MRLQLAAPVLEGGEGRLLGGIADGVDPCFCWSVLRDVSVDSHGNDLDIGPRSLSQRNKVLG